MLIDIEVETPYNESTSEAGYAGPTHNNVWRMDQEAFVEHEEHELSRPIDITCKKVVLGLSVI